MGLVIFIHSICELLFFQCHFRPSLPLTQQRLLAMKSSRENVTRQQPSSALNATVNPTPTPKPPVASSQPQPVLTNPAPTQNIGFGGGAAAGGFGQMTKLAGILKTSAAPMNFSVSVGASSTGAVCYLMLSLSIVLIFQTTRSVAAPVQSSTQAFNPPPQREQPLRQSTQEQPLQQQPPKAAVNTSCNVTRSDYTDAPVQVGGVLMESLNSFSRCTVPTCPTIRRRHSRQPEVRRLPVAKRMNVGRSVIF